MCVSHLHVQLMSQKSYGPLALCPPGRRNWGPHPGVGGPPTGLSQIPLQTHRHTGPGTDPRHVTFRTAVNFQRRQSTWSAIFFFFLLYFQFDFPFVEVHRVKAVRFSLPPGKEDDDYEGICGTNVGPDDGQTGNVEAVSRNGSRQRLSEDSAGQDAAEGQKARSSFLCGLCCSKAPEVSVWNCDGEILSVTEIMCRYKSFFLSLQCFFFFCNVITGTTTFPLRVHAQLVRLYARGIEAANNSGDQS